MDDSKSTRRQKPGSRSRSRIVPPPSRPDEHAEKIAGSVSETWHQAYGSGRLEVPVSVVAALAMLEGQREERQVAAGTLLRCSEDEFAELMRFQWKIFATYRPDLVVPASPLIMVWWGETALEDHLMRAARRVGGAAVRAGLLELTGTARRYDTDLFGVLLMTMRPRSALSARGQFYTPTEVAGVLSCFALNERDAAPGSEKQSVYEPTAGTGGFFRAAAEAMRQQGRDPANSRWAAADVDELAIACLAINVVLWGLGLDVLLDVTDSLRDPSFEKAAAQRREMIELARGIRFDQAALQALQFLAGPDRRDGGGDGRGSSVVIDADDGADPEHAHNAAGADDAPRDETLDELRLF